MGRINRANVLLGELILLDGFIKGDSMPKPGYYTVTYRLKVRRSRSIFQRKRMKGLFKLNNPKRRPPR